VAGIGGYGLRASTGSIDKISVGWCDTGANQRWNVLYVTEKRSNRFAPLKGVRRGCVLSQYLFNIMAELLMRIALDRFDGGFRISEHLLTNLTHPGDTVLIASTEKEGK